MHIISICRVGPCTCALHVQMQAHVRSCLISLWGPHGPPSAFRFYRVASLSGFFLFPPTLDLERLALVRPLVNMFLGTWQGAQKGGEVWPTGGLKPRT